MIELSPLSISKTTPKNVNRFHLSKKIKFVGLFCKECLLKVFFTKKNHF